jgi:Ca2+-binding EF-hand superfamily protein
LFREIAFNRVTEELKQRLAASKDFNFWRAFLAIDDWNYGYIDKKNLAIFLKRNGSKTTTSEVMAIIRRLDLDCDARLTF